MTRLVGPDEASRTVYTIVGGVLRSAAGLVATVYTDSGGTTLANILTQPGGSTISGSQVTVDAYSRMPLFQFPDAVDTVYTSVNGGPVVPLYARTSSSLLGTAAAVAAQVPAAGQRVVETDTGYERTGDGTTAAASLPVVAGPEDQRWIQAVALSSTNGSPTLSVSGGGSRFATWDMDAATPEQVSASFQIPGHWGHFNLDLYWCNRGGGSGDVQWRPTYSVRADGTDLSSGDVVGSDTIVTAGANNILKVTRLAAGVTRAAGVYHVRILRRADQAGDTLGNDAGILGVLLGKA